MPDISVNKQHSIEPSVLRERLDGLVDSLIEKYGLKASWSGDTCTLTGTGLKKAVLVMGTSTVKLDITLGMMGKMFKPQIEKEIDKKIVEILES